MCLRMCALSISSQLRVYVRLIGRVVVLVVLAAEISGLLLDEQQDMDMELPPHINGKEFPAIPQNSLLTHPR